MNSVRCFLRISRWRIQLVSLATITLGPLFAAGTTADMIDFDLLIFAVLFLSIITFACNINCFYDIEVDSLKKKRLADAVRHIGRTKLKILLVLESITALIAVSYFAFLERYLISILGLIGLLLAHAYSAPPMRLKSKGILSPVPVNVGVYVLPIIAGYLVIDSVITPLFLTFVLGYALLNLGINLVNTAEDYTVDKKIGIKTAAHSIGLKYTIYLSSVSTITGGTVIVIIFALKTSMEILPLALLFLILITVGYTAFEITGILSHDNLEKAAQSRGKRLPLYFVVTRYPMVLFLLALLT